MNLAKPWISLGWLGICTVREETQPATCRQHVSKQHPRIVRVLGFSFPLVCDSPWTILGKKTSVPLLEQKVTKSPPSQRRKEKQLQKKGQRRKYSTPQNRREVDGRYNSKWPFIRYLEVTNNLWRGHGSPSQKGCRELPGIHDYIYHPPHHNFWE